MKADINTGGHAFPISRGHFAPDGKMMSADWTPGMTLRQYYAGQALAGFTANTGNVAHVFRSGDEANSEVLARLSVRYADALIAELAKEPAHD